ncbi:hypothetical protein FHG87_023367 [Trinorchestia longiramus]|nr:hypothetical protein FHG87_023367 [Trinorchestia longiramus]
MISDGLCLQIGTLGSYWMTNSFLCPPYQLLKLIQKNLNLEVHSFEGFSPEQGNFITPAQHTGGKIPQKMHSTNSTNILVEPSMEDASKNRKFLANDVVLSKTLANSAFGKEGIANIKKNLGRNILVVTMKKHYEAVLPFLSVQE